MARKKINILTKTVSQLLQNVSEGRFAIPKLQREFVWDGPKAAKLLPVHEDSGVWVRNVRRGFKRFLKERTDVICRALEDEAGIRLFRRDL